MENFDINQIKEILNFNKRYHKEETLQEQMKKIEDLYPNCFDNIEFAKYIGKHKDELNDLRLNHLIDFFGKDSQEVIISYCAYYELSHEIHSKLENEIMKNLSDEGYEALNLSDDVWIDYNAATMPRVQGEKENVEGVRITIEENEYDDEGLNPQAFSAPVGIFVPLDNFEDARMDHWNERYIEQNKGWEETLKPLLEAVKNQRFKNVQEIYKEVQYEKEKHDISEIKETVSDRNISDINKAISEIAENSKDKQKDGQTIGD